MGITITAMVETSYNGRWEECAEFQFNKNHELRRLLNENQHLVHKLDYTYSLKNSRYEYSDYICWSTRDELLQIIGITGLKFGAPLLLGMFATMEYLEKENPPCRAVFFEM